MTYPGLLRFGASAAIVGGALRVFASFIAYREASIELEVFYGLIDMCLLFGLLTFYFYVSEQLNWVGMVGFIIAVAGLASIVGPDPTLWGIDLYMLGATMLMVGLSAMAIAMLQAYVMKASALYWLAALVAGVISVLSGSAFVFAISGTLFGLGFVSGGVTILVKLGRAEA